jgi:formyltetrahydrofolate deformylase
MSVQVSYPTLIARIHGPDASGLVARTAHWIYERGGNILHADQHRDSEAGIFFQRIEWIAEKLEAADVAAFKSFCTSLGMKVTLSRTDDNPPVALFVSRQDHCFHDLLLRARSGELRGKISCIISNHRDLEGAAETYGVPFFYVPVTSATKPKAESRQLEILRAHNTQLVVLARYMQVLSSDFLRQVGCPVINIHHSFLPAFAGARPYHQAYERGVKIIGATAHYATEILDEGPIIQQDVTPVTHRHDVNDLIRKGRDMEKIVLAQAVRWHLEHRVLTYANKTVVFD